MLSFLIISYDQLLLFALLYNLYVNFFLSHSKQLMVSKDNCKGNDKDIGKSNSNKQKDHWTMNNKKLFLNSHLRKNRRGIDRVKPSTMSVGNHR